LGGPTGKVQTGIVEGTGFNFAGDAVNKTLAVGYGSNGAVNAGFVDFYAGQITRIMLLSTTGIAVTGFISCDNVLSTTASITAGTTIKPGTYTVAALPAGTVGQIAYSSNGRKVGEGPAAGTGVIVYYSNAAWRVFSTDAVVAA